MEKNQSFLTVRISHQFRSNTRNLTLETIMMASGSFLRVSSRRKLPFSAHPSQLLRRNPKNHGQTCCQHPRQNANFSTSSGRQQFTAITRRNKATIANGEVSSTRQSSQDIINSFLNKPRTVPIPRWLSPTHTTTTLSECFGHSSFILVATSYAVDDFLELRLIAIAGSAAMLVFTYFHPHGRVLWLPFKWNVLFIAINSYRVGKVFLDRYLAQQLSPELERTYENHFSVMDRVIFYKLVKMGAMETYRRGDVIVRQGDESKVVRLVIKGDLDVLRDGQITYQLHEGNFVAETGLHAGLYLRGNVESSCDIVARTDEVTMLQWNRTELVHLLELDSHTRRSLKAALSWDIVSKLKSQRVLLSSGIIEDPERWTHLRREQSWHRYAAILHNMLSRPKELKQRKVELRRYRKIHHIDDAHHEAALKQVGWTLAEYEAGHKDGAKDLTKEDGEESGWRWYMNEIYLRIFG